MNQKQREYLDLAIQSETARLQWDEDELEQARQRVAVLEAEVAEHKRRIAELEDSDGVCRINGCRCRRQHEQAYA